MKHFQSFFFDALRFTKFLQKRGKRLWQRNPFKFSFFPLIPFKQRRRVFFFLRQNSLRIEKFLSLLCSFNFFDFFLHSCGMVSGRERERGKKLYVMRTASVCGNFKKILK
jgi:hypothetical protein